MKPVLIGEVVVLARALLARPAPDRRALAQRVIHEARAAERHLRLYQKAHPSFGTGTLMAAASRRPLAPERFVDDPEFLACLELGLSVLSALSDPVSDPVMWAGHHAQARVDLHQPA